MAGAGRPAGRPKPPPLAGVAPIGGFYGPFFFGKKKRVIGPTPGYQDDPPCMNPPSVRRGSPLPSKAPFEKKQSKRMTYKIKCWMT